MARLKPLDTKALYRQAEELHQACAESMNCSERVFLVLHRLMETDIPPQAVSLMSGFGGGVGGTRENACGAVTGGVAAIGLIHGRPNPPEGSRVRAYEVSREFVSQFRTTFGMTGCRELIGDLTREATPEAEAKRKARCFQYTLAAIKAAIDTLKKYETC
ncbi:MAG: C-GCAxxG-C-C family protein [Candidatus Methylomirabilota bacterium]